MPGKGGSSEPNGPNQTARDAGRDEGLTKGQQEELPRRLGEEDARTYREVREIAREVKEDYPNKK